MNRVRPFTTCKVSLAVTLIRADLLNEDERWLDALAMVWLSQDEAA